MGMLRTTTVWLMVSFIQACSSSHDATQASKSPPAPATSSPPHKTVFDPLTGTLGKARAVQGSVDENAERTRRAVDNEERGDSPP